MALTTDNNNLYSFLKLFVVMVTILMDVEYFYIYDSSFLKFNRSTEMQTVTLNKDEILAHYTYIEHKNTKISKIYTHTRYTYQ